MSGPDAMHGEMPGFFPGRPGGGDHDEPLLDTILDRRPLPPGAPPEMHVLAWTLASAAGPADPRELAGEAAAMAAFRRLASPDGISPAALRPARRWLPRRPARGRLPLAAVLVTAAAGLGSIAAAYVGVLPGPIQEMVHVTVGAPPASGDHSPRTHAASSPPRSALHETSPSGRRQPSSADPAPAPSQTGRQQPRHGVPSPGRVIPTCTPGPVPTRNPLKPGSAQYPTPGPGQPGWTPRPSPTAGCLVIVTQTAPPRTGH
jgi:hypothetical protein